MKSCYIDDEFVQSLAESLTDNTNLNHLNLSCNHVSDIGCCALAICLRLNRTLLSLVLTNNQIQDDGAVALAEVDLKVLVILKEFIVGCLSNYCYC